MINLDKTVPEQAGDDHENRELLAWAVLNSLNLHIAVLDRHGTIIATNQAWKNFALKNGGTPEATGVGVNYLELCQRAITQETEAEITQILQGVGSIIRREAEEFVVEYPCLTPSAERWFSMRATPVNNDPAWVVISHLDITEQKQAAALLRQSEQTLRTIFEILPVGISVLDQDRRIVDANPALGTILEVSPGDLLTGNYERRRYIEHDGTPLLPDGLPSARVLRENQVIQNVEIGVVKEDGAIIWTSVNAAPLPPPTPGVVVATTGITERKRAESALQEANVQLQRRVDELLALNRITQAVTMITDLPTVLNTVAEVMTTLFNAFSASISLYDPEQTQRKIVAMYDPFHPERSGLVGYTISLQDDPLNLKLLETCQSIIVPHPQTHPLTAAYHDIMQARNVQSLLLVPLLARAELIGNIGLSSREPGREFTLAEAKLAETIAGQIAGAVETARLFDEAQRTRDAAEAANQAKSDFLANISHELRTPLNGVLGYTQMLRRDPALAHHQESLGIIQQNGEYLLTLLSDILDLSKIEAGKMELYPGEFHLGYFLESITAIFRVQAQQKEVDFIYDPSPALPVAVHGDEKRLRQVLINLLGNALKFTEKGQVIFTVAPVKGDREPAASTGELKEGAPTSQLIRFQVQDTGPGINEEDLEKIFAPFQQLAPQSGWTAGTGLGLSISRRLVDVMGGTLEVESRPGEGSTFWMEVNLSIAAAWSQPPPPSVIEQSEREAQPLPFVGPPLEEGATLLTLARIGDINGLWEQAAYLEQLGEQYRPFVAELRRLAKGFQIEKIQALIKNYVEE